MRLSFLAALICFSSTLFVYSTDANPELAQELAILQPWFTGPLLAAAGHTIPKGHTNWEPYIFATGNLGTYSQGNVGKSTEVNPLINMSHGLTEWMDIQVISGLIWNFADKQNDIRLSDTIIYFGFQALNDKRGFFCPDLRITLSEVFPSGHYQYLDPKKKGTDSTGGGSFQTSLFFNFQKLFVFTSKLFRVRLNLGYTVPSFVKVHSFNTYGGGYGANARVRPGGRFSTILGGELMLNQNWVVAIDLAFNRQSKTTYTGNPGVLPNGQKATLKSPYSTQFSLAPAIEYNFNENVGIIGGVWFTVAGRNSQDFASGVLAINVYH